MFRNFWTQANLSMWQLLFDLYIITNNLLDSLDAAFY